MTDDATLSDFGSTESGEADDTDDSGVDDGCGDVDGRDVAATDRDDSLEKRSDSSEPTGETTADRSDADGDIAAGEPARSTYAWGAYRCTHCGTETDRVWRADGQFVCPACKSW